MNSQNLVAEAFKFQLQGSVPMTPGANKRPVMHSAPMSLSSSTSISPEAMQAWGRIPQPYKSEIIEAVEHPSVAIETDTKFVRLGARKFTIRRVQSGFRVVYELGNGRNTIVSVMTPREARLIDG